MSREAAEEAKPLSPGSALATRFGVLLEARMEAEVGASGGTMRTFSFWSKKSDRRKSVSFWAGCFPCLRGKGRGSLSSRSKNEVSNAASLMVLGVTLSRSELEVLSTNSTGAESVFLTVTC